MNQAILQEIDCNRQNPHRNSNTTMSEEQTCVIRTGCLSCRARGRRCDPNDPKCKRHSSETWDSNRSLDRRWRGQLHPSYQTWFSGSSQRVRSLQQTWTGTLRERQSLHFFTVISASELSGLLDRTFWQESLLQATHLDAAIKHGVAAIGAFHEYQLRRQAGRLNSETEALRVFALKQCNKAISTLVRPVKTTESNLKRALVASVLFSCFESLNGNRDGAIPHVVWSRKLLLQHKEGRQNVRQGGVKDEREEPFPVEVATVEPLVAHYELQLGEYIFETNPGDLIKPLDADEPPVFRGIADAQISLERAVASLGVLCWKLDNNPSPQNIRTTEQKKSQYRTWFKQWDRELSNYLGRNGASLGTGVLDAWRLLKAHHTAALVLASVEYGKGEDTWARFVPEYRKVVELMTEIIKNMPKKGPTYQVPQTPYFSATIGLTEPLYCAMVRCVDKKVADDARALLSKLPQNEGVHSVWRTAFIERCLCSATGKRFVDPSAKPKT